MIHKDCFTNDWITRVSKDLGYPDVNLIEKVIRAFSIVEMLSDAQCPFVWKGGTALMLLLGNSLHRLSIDVDIICPPGTEIEDYLKNIEKHGFLRVESVERIQRSTLIPKTHSKFFYQIAYLTNTDKLGCILLDVLYENIQYRSTKQLPIKSPFIRLDGEPLLVNVPSIDDILGDKLTAFAPNTSGIPYYKKGKDCFLEIIKQLYDIARLFDNATNIDTVSDVFVRIAAIELAYRRLEENPSIVCEDIRQTALCLATRGKHGNGNFAGLQEGINRLRSFMYLGKYYIEQAIVDAAKAAYLVTMIEKRHKAIERYDGNINGLEIDSILTSRLNKLKLPIPEAYFYWCKTSELLSQGLQ